MLKPLTIDIGRNRIVVVGRGRVTFDEIIDCFNATLAHPDFRRGMDALIDLRDAYQDVTVEQLQAAARITGPNDERRGTDYKVAFVVDSSITYGQSRQFGSFSSRMPVEVEVFRDIEEAMAWLDEKPDLNDQP